MDLFRLTRWKTPKSAPNGSTNTGVTAMIKKIEKITETMINVMTNVFLTVAMFILMLFAVGVMVYGLTHQNFDYSCAYCHGTITEDADYVCMTDGRRMHAECYIGHIEEVAE
jgi:hypothetical protein